MSEKRSIAKTVNPFKLFYYRRMAGLTVEALSEKTDISPDKLKRLEQGTAEAQGRPQTVADFAFLDDAGLRKIKVALECKSDLRGGQEDDFATQLLHYYETHKPQDGRIEPIPENAVKPKTFSPKAIVFDFDGTLTERAGVNRSINRNTWERIWVGLGYTVSDCGTLAHRYFRDEIDHEEWCRLTL